MLRRRTLALPLLALPLLVLPLLVLPVAATAQEQTPIQFLQAIYEPYRKAGFKGQPYWDPGRFFVPDLARAIERDMAEAKKRKEPPTLDGDPFVDAQEWQITSIAYGNVIAGDKAAAGVAFVNQGEPRSLAITLAKTQAGWRIHDIVGSNGSLRALFKLH